MKFSDIGALTFLALCGIAINGCSGSSSDSSTGNEEALMLMPENNENTQTDVDSIGMDSVDANDDAVCTPSPRATTDTRPYLGNLYRTETANDERFHQLWNQVTPENAGKWNAIEAQRDSMNWSALDDAFNLSLIHI